MSNCGAFVKAAKSAASRRSQPDAGVLVSTGYLASLEGELQRLWSVVASCGGGPPLTSTVVSAAASAGGSPAGSAATAGTKEAVTF